MVKPGGLLFLSTLNRTAEERGRSPLPAPSTFCGWLPRGTHEWDKFVTPDELATAMEAPGLTVTDRRGVRYDVLRDRWTETGDLAVNYMMTAARAA